MMRFRAKPRGSSIESCGMYRCTIPLICRNSYSEVPSAYGRGATMVANPRSLTLLWPIPSPSRLPFVRRRFPFSLSPRPQTVTP
jgi:hypothetical protein